MIAKRGSSLNWWFLTTQKIESMVMIKSWWFAINMPSPNEKIPLPTNTLLLNFIVTHLIIFCGPYIPFSQKPITPINYHSLLFPALVIRVSLLSPCEVVTYYYYFCLFYQELCILINYCFYVCHLTTVE